MRKPRKKPRNYRGVSLPESLVMRVEKFIQGSGSYRTKAEFISEAIRLRLETLEKRKKREEAA